MQLNFRITEGNSQSDLKNLKFEPPFTIFSSMNNEKIPEFFTIYSSSSSNLNKDINEEISDEKPRNSLAKTPRFKRKCFFFNSNYSKNNKRMKLREINKDENRTDGAKKLYQQFKKFISPENKAQKVANSLYRAFCVLNPRYPLDKLTNKKFDENMQKLIEKVKEIHKKPDDDLFDLLLQEKKYKLFVKKVMKMPNIIKKKKPKDIQRKKNPGNS